MNNYDEYDQESQALLHGIKSLSFEEMMGNGQQNPFSDLAKSTSNTAIKRKNPLAYSPLSKSGTDVQNNFFQGSKVYGNNNLQITVDPNSSIDPYKKIIPIERGFYYDKNNNGIQDEDEKYVVTIKLFISKDATQLKETYNDPTIKPDPKEILFFLEDNDKDFSGTTLHIKRGNQVDATLNELLAKSETFTNYIKSKYGISLSDLQELIRKGVVENNIQNFIFSIVEMASFFVSNPAIFNGIALGIKKAVDTIKETCIIEEKNWNPKKAEENFSPFLFPFAPSLDALDDKAINDLIKSSIQVLTDEANVFDKKIENTLNVISQIKIPIIFPIINFSHSVSIPDTFTDLLLMKYRQLRFTMDGIIANLNNIDFSTLIKDGINTLNAFLCGIWNGFVEAVCGIISLVQYLFQGAEFLTDLLKNFKEKGPALLEQIDDIILQFQSIDFGKIITKLAINIKEWALSDSTISLVELAYFSGMFIGIVIELVIEIVFGTLFTGGTLSIAAIMTKLGETFKALGSLLRSIIKAPFKLAGKTISAFAEGLHWLYEFLKKGTDEILRIVDEVFEAFKTYSKESLTSLNSQIPLLGKAELQLYKKIIAIFYNNFKKLLLEYTDVTKALKTFERLKAMKDLSAQDIEEMLRWRKTLVGENKAFNVAIMKQEIKVNGEIIEFEYKAFAGDGISANGFCKNPDRQYIAKQLDLTDEEMMKHYETLNKDGTMRRFFDSEHKIFAQNDKDIHALYTKYGKENVQIIRQNVKTLFEPCPSCKKQFLIRQKLYVINNLTIEATRFNSHRFVVNNKEFLNTLKK